MDHILVDSRLFDLDTEQQDSLADEEEIAHRHWSARSSPEHREVAAMARAEAGSRAARTWQGVAVSGPVALALEDHTSMRSEA